MKHSFKSKILICLVTMALATPAMAFDVGKEIEKWIQANTKAFFGIDQALQRSARGGSRKGFRRSGQKASDQLVIAKGLKVEYLTRKVAHFADMMAFYPRNNPTHLIVCIEVGRKKYSNGRYNISVQRVSLADGRVETVLHGMSQCDGIRATPWGTILATEESSRGGAYEILDPLRLTGATITNRTKGTSTAPNLVAKRRDMPTMSWEGLTVLKSGVVIGGDELRPGDNGVDSNGGSIFKFVPSRPHRGGSISRLSQSPLVSGKAFAMQVSCFGNKQQFGQGCEVGRASWIRINAATARKDANQKFATGYYRPEDMHADPNYQGRGVRFCWANTSSPGARNYGEVMCAVDADPLTARAGKMTVTVNRFIEGDKQFNAFDNLAFQPRTGNLYVAEDTSHGDVWACLPDGADTNLKSDGCVRVLSVIDTSAEPSGIIFDASGETAYMMIQHSNDNRMRKSGGQATDDLVKITGFQIPVVVN